MKIETVGSVCSGIEAASIAWKPMGLNFEWFSEIAEFPSRVLQDTYPDIPNLGDMTDIPEMLLSNKIKAPDLICGGTPCQAFSLAGLKNGLNDDRGNLTLKFINLVDANDTIRREEGFNSSVVLWENVEGVLNDKTNAFGCFVSSLAGLDNNISIKRWPNAGVIRGPKRNVAWRVLDAKFFGVPQQRRRLYLLAGGKDFYPENILFETYRYKHIEYPEYKLSFMKNGHEFEVFREYTDCLYSAYGTKWNGNAAAYNGSLFVIQNNRLRRLSPLECERLMGFPDNYTNIEGAKRTNRYQAIGNSWAVPVIRWIGKKMMEYTGDSLCLHNYEKESFGSNSFSSLEFDFWDLGRVDIELEPKLFLNSAAVPNKCNFKNLKEIITADEVPEKIYISPTGCAGILRRKQERSLSMNKRLEEVLLKTSELLTHEEIEKKSRVQKRGKFSLDEIENERVKALLV